MINKGKICIICEDTETKTKGMCKICYSREYKKNNKEKIKPVKQKQYLRRREYFIEQSREWERNHREITNARMRKYNKENKELKDLREKTR